MTSYYNENDPYAAQWLRNLIDAKHIAYGDVDTRSILDVSPSDLTGYTQCHFFAGIGAWSYALRLAGWPDDRPAWTGSCPCQPFSLAGVGNGFDDERHLWPFWHYLIEQRRPPVVFGEQVEAAAKHGWLDLVQADLEGSGYACATVNIPTAGVGAPHIRQRLWFVAYTSSDRQLREGARRETEKGRPTQPEPSGQLPHGLKGYGLFGGVGNANDTGLEGFGGGHRTEGQRVDEVRPTSPTGEPDNPGAVNGFWANADWLYCRDGKWRAVEPGTFPLVDGAASRVGRLRAYGNAISPQVACEFVKAYMECRP